MPKRKKKSKGKEYKLGIDKLPSQLKGGGRIGRFSPRIEGEIIKVTPKQLHRARKRKIKI